MIIKTDNPLFESKPFNTEEPKPQEGITPVWPLVVSDMIERDKIGAFKYGTPLKTWNGRKPLIDAYQELLDLIVYLRQEVAENNDRHARLGFCFAALRKDGNGLTLTQEQEILKAVGF